MSRDGAVAPDSLSLAAHDNEDYEALLQFLYLAPVGLAQLTVSGDFVMLNPLFSQLLMPLARDGALTNLFRVLEGVAPDLSFRTESFQARHGMICDAFRFAVGTGEAGLSTPQTLSISLRKLDDKRLMAVLSDVSEQVMRERLLRQNEAWLNAILTESRDYALVSLDSHGMIDDWNASVGRVTGFTREQVLGQPLSLFHPAGGMTSDRMQDLLRDADDNGWSLDDGWRVRADGSRFWSSAMISPLREKPFSLSPGTRDGAAQAKCGYSLVIRDINDRGAGRDRVAWSAAPA